MSLVANFKTPCPVSQCFGCYVMNSKPAPMCSWTHSDCPKTKSGTGEYVHNDGNVECLSCGHKDKIWVWAYKCNKKVGDYHCNEHKQPDKASLLAALTMVI